MLAELAGDLLLIEGTAMCVETKTTGDVVEFVPLMRMAARLGVSNAWLKKQADNGSIPALRAGTNWLFRPDVVAPAVAVLTASGSNRKGGTRGCNARNRTLTLARHRFLKRLERGPATFTEVIRELTLSEGSDGRMFGTLVRELHRDGLIRPVGYVPSNNSCCHSRLWELVDESKRND